MKGKDKRMPVAFSETFIIHSEIFQKLAAVMKSVCTLSEKYTT